MSKLIVEMEIPLSCVECPIGDYFHKPCPLRDDDCRSYDQFQAYRMNERPSWCPIVGVLPEEYGDLIDRDKLFDAINSRVALIDSCSEGKPSMKELFERDVICVCLHDVVCAKAVIAAERIDDEQIH